MVNMIKFSLILPDTPQIKLVFVIKITKKSLHSILTLKYHLSVLCIFQRYMLAFLGKLCSALIGVNQRKRLSAKFSKIFKKLLVEFFFIKLVVFFGRKRY